MYASNSAPQVSTVLKVAATPAARRAARTSASVRPEQVAELGVGEAQPLGPPPRRPVEAPGRRCRQCRQLPAPGGDAGPIWCEEPRVDAGRAPPPPPPRGRAAAPPPPRRCRSGVATDARSSSSSSPRASSAASAGSAFSPARPCSSERTAFCSDSQNVRPMAITSPTDCIRVPSRPSEPGQLLEGPAGDLGDHVVDGRLEAGRGGPGDVVGDLVEAVADGQAGGDLGDGEAGGLGGQGRGARHPGVHLDDQPPAGRPGPRRTARWTRRSPPPPAAGRRRRRRAWPGTRRRSGSGPGPR